jgi:hypothetical protein
LEVEDILRWAVLVSESNISVYENDPINTAFSFAERMLTQAEDTGCVVFRDNTLLYKTWLITCTKKYRRGRAAALNMVITETGAGTAVASLERCSLPVPNGS